MCSMGSGAQLFKRNMVALAFIAVVVLGAPAVLASSNAGNFVQDGFTVGDNVNVDGPRRALAQSCSSGLLYLAPSGTTCQGYVDSCNLQRGTSYTYEQFMALYPGLQACCPRKLAPLTGMCYACLLCA